MKVFSEYLEQIDDQSHRTRMENVLVWVSERFPELEPRVAWNQPMFTNHGTFIIGFSASKNHMAVSPERAGVECFSNEIAAAGYGQSKMLFRIKWEEPVDYLLLANIINFNCLEKADCITFWRK